VGDTISCLQITLENPMRFISLLLVVAGLLLSPLCGLAQAPQPVVSLKAEVEAARKLIETERKLVIINELTMTPAEAKEFWPVYNEYTEELREISDIRSQLIIDYAANYNNMTDDFATRMLDDYFDYSSQMLKTRQKYVRKFERVLPTIKVARLYQVENKLDAILNFNLAAQIPLLQEQPAPGN